MKRPELPIDLSGILKALSNIFSFSRRQLLTASAIFIAALVAAIIITAAATASSRPKVQREESSESATAGSEINEVRPYLSDFMLIEDNLEKTFTGIVYSREILQRWPQEQIDKYWVDPEEIVADQLEEEAEKDIMDIFADVP